jgi:hypothetical protein
MRLKKLITTTTLNVKQLPRFKKLALKEKPNKNFLILV